MTKTLRPTIALMVSLGLLWPVRTATAADISLAFPLQCEPGRTCLFQNYVDHDASENVRDYHCGGRSYDGHDGTDIRVRGSDARGTGIEVRAAASGRVAGMRNEMPDISIRIAGKASVAGKECGNGAVIEHGDGWQTQYCHLAQGSLLIKTGDQVSAGQPIGRVGLSGETEFHHLHFTVRRNGRIIDPFAYQAAPDACGGGHSLWQESIRRQTEYRSGEILDYGFVDLAPTMDLLESGDNVDHAVMRQSQAMVAYVRAIGLQIGDRQSLELHDPEGKMLSQFSPAALDHDKAQYLTSAGRKLVGENWPPGTYVATYRLWRDGAEVLQKRFEIGIQ